MGIKKHWLCKLLGHKFKYLKPWFVCERCGHHFHNPYPPQGTIAVGPPAAHAPSHASDGADPINTPLALAAIPDLPIARITDIALRGYSVDPTRIDFLRSLDVNAQDTSPRGMAWNNDGSKLYMVGNANDSIYEYNVSTPYDISTATYSKTLDVGTQDTFPVGMAWNNDGSKLYMVGNANANIYEYNVSTPYDIATATYSKTLDVSTQDIAPKGMAWNNDGTKLYMVGDINDSIYEYNVSTPYDIATAVYSKTLDVSGQDTTSLGMAWNNDGSKLYMVGNANNSIYEYNVSTPYDIATAVYSKTLDVSGQDHFPCSMAWNNDGTKLYMVGDTNKSIYEYASDPFLVRV